MTNESFQVAMALDKDIQILTDGIDRIEDYLKRDVLKNQAIRLADSSDGYLHVHDERIFYNWYLKYAQDRRGELIQAFRDLT